MLELLKDKLYLTLLAFYHQKKMPNYTSLGKEIGLTRQTIKKKIDILIEKGLIEIKENKIFVKNELNLDIKKLSSLLQDFPNITPLDLRIKLFEDKDEDMERFSKEMKLSKSTLYHYKNSQIVIYGIILDGELKYVGNSKCYEERVKTHILKRPFFNKG